MARFVILRYIGITVFRDGGSQHSSDIVVTSNGTIWDTRFAPDTPSIIYGAAWDSAPQGAFRLVVCLDVVDGIE
jgi:hypothetical protein